VSGRLSTDRPLPALSGTEGWRYVDIEPVDEPLVEVASVGLLQDPRYFAMGLAGAIDTCRVRHGVAEALAVAEASLPDGMRLLVWDGFRSLETQAALYNGYLDELIATNADCSPEELEEQAARYVTPPSRSRVAPPPHFTGGAVDLTLADADGQPLDLGTGFDAFVAEAGTLALEAADGTVRANRRILFWAMIEAGFTAYVEEWWHFDLGDQFWGLATGRPAYYGPADQT
jgi:zinc D-Ala-D-Ala dipeptidase